MFVLYVKKLILGSVKNLFAHLRSVHFLCEVRGVILKCGQDDCVRCYSTFNSLSRHLHTQHPGHRSPTGDFGEISLEATNDHSVLTLLVMLGVLIVLILAPVIFQIQLLLLLLACYLQHL